jgi:hypothetical protein
MTALENIENILLGKHGYVNNRLKPFDEKYWERKKTSYLDEIKNEMTYKDEKTSMELFNKLHLTSTLQKMLSYVDDVPLYHIIIGARASYYHLLIRMGCYSLLKEISAELRSNGENRIDETLLRLRWLIFEANSHLVIFSDGIEAALSIDQYEQATDGETLSAMNYLLTIHFRDSLIRLYENLELINGGSGTDNYVSNIKNQSNIGEILFPALEMHIAERVLTDKIERVNDMYKTVKDLFYESRNEQTKLAWFDEILLRQLATIEDAIFCRSLFAQIVGEDQVDVSQNKEKGEFEHYYSQIANLIRNETLPSARIAKIENIIATIMATLLDDPLRDDISFFDSIARKVMRRLSIDCETIRANPKIDLKTLDSNTIKPIQTNVSVSHLALLFRVLEENAIIKPEERNEFYRTISTAFASRSLTGTSISEKSFKNSYNDPDKGSYKFWKEKFLLFSGKFKNFN